MVPAACVSTSPARDSDAPLTAGESIEGMVKRGGQLWPRAIVISGLDGGGLKELVKTKACLQREENPVETM